MTSFMRGNGLLVNAGEINKGDETISQEIQQEGKLQAMCINGKLPIRQWFGLFS